LFGAGGAALLNPLRIHRGMHGTLVNVTPTMDTPRNMYKQSMEAQIAHFAESLRRGARPEGDADEILPVRELMDAIYRSAEQGRGLPGALPGAGLVARGPDGAARPRPAGARLPAGLPGGRGAARLGRARLPVVPAGLHAGPVRARGPAREPRQRDAGDAVAAG